MRRKPDEAGFTFGFGVHDAVGGSDLRQRHLQQSEHVYSNVVVDYDDVDRELQFQFLWAHGAVHDLEPGYRPAGLNAGGSGR